MLPEVDRFNKWLLRKNPHSSTHIHYTNDVKLFFLWHRKPPEEVRTRDIDTFIELSLQQGQAKATINRRLASLRSFYHFLSFESDAPLPNPVIPKRHFIRLGRQLPHDVEDRDIERLFSVIISRRDRALFLLMLRCGLRVGEIRNLSLSDLYLQPSPGSLPRLWIRGKGGAERVAYLSPQALTALKEWLEVRPFVKDQAVFLNRFGHRLTVTGIQLQLASYCHKAGLWLTCHQLRHTFGRHLVEARVPVTSIQRLLGHARLRTTELYARLRSAGAGRLRASHEADRERLAARGRGAMKATRYPGIKSIHQWFPANQGFYACYLDWLSEASYSKNAIRLYGFGARIALGLIDKPYFLMDPLADFQRVEDYLILHFPSEGTRSSYHKGVLKLQQYLLQRCHQPAPEKPLHWDYYLGILPVALADGVRSYLGHCRRSWPAELQYRRSIGLLSRLTCSLRWLATNRPFGTAKDLAPALWFDYLDARLAAGITPRTLNSELQSLQSFLRFLSEQEEDICERILKVEPLAEGPHLPRDVPLEQLKMLLATVVVDANSTHAGIRRMGVMDKAWFLLMLHSGFRSGEVRRLRLEDLDLARKRARIVQSKGLKDRIVCLSQTTVDALKAYLDLRGPTPDSHVFIFRHSALSDFYIAQRLETYGWRCGVRITPHQLRHSCATLLLNAGAPILTVQTILGRKHIDTTLGYARLYDGTVAADYYRAMTMVESRMELVQVKPEIPTSSAHLLALVDSLTAGVLSDSQREKIDALRMAVLALVQQQGASTEPVNLPNQAAKRSADIACVTP